MRLWYVRHCSGWTSLWCWTASLAALMSIAAAQTAVPIPLWLTAVPLTASVAALLDEPAASVADVAPRTRWWRGSARMLPAVVPLSVWALGLAALAARDDALDRRGWQLVGIALCSLALGAAAAAAAQGSATPGGMVGACMALLVVMPAVQNPLPASVPLFPAGTFPAASTLVWMAVLTAGAIAFASGMRDRPGSGMVSA